MTARKPFAVPVNFVHPSIDEWMPKISTEANLDSPEFVQSVIQPGTNCWTIQTFLRLRARGHQVQISSDFKVGAINVAHYDSIPASTSIRKFFVVSIRADRDPTFVANLELCQCAASVAAPNQYAISLWPQAALIPRAPARKAKLRTLYFMGVPENLAAAFQGNEFQSMLSTIGVSFVSEHNKWWDYSKVDAVLAVRDGKPYFLQHKPASKLINAWLAGCPALLGPEPAYREVGQPGEDYLEVSNPSQAFAAIKRLHDDPAFYESIVARGRRKAESHTIDAVAAQWEGFLANEATRKYRRWCSSPLSKDPFAMVDVAYKLSRRRLWGYQYYKGVDENGKPFPESSIGRIRRRLFQP